MSLCCCACALQGPMLPVAQHGMLLQLLFSSQNRSFGGSAAAFTAAFSQPEERKSACCSALLLLEVGTDLVACLPYRPSTQRP